MELLLLIGALGIFTGFLSGMLGIGGGIIMAPLLLYAPIWFGFPPIPMKVVAGLTIVQGLVACISGAITHKRFQFVSNSLISWMGLTIFIAALIGGAAADYVAGSILMAIFAVLAIVAASLIFIPTKGDSEKPDISKFSFSKMRAVVASGSVGFFGGMVGQGGSFILIPLMTSYVKVPTRIAIGSNLAVVSLSTFAAFLGKACTGQIDWYLSIPIILTVIPAAHVGGLASQKVPVHRLRIILAFFIFLAAIRVGISSFGF